MNQLPKQMHKVTTERVVGFGAAVRSLGTHIYCGVPAYYRPEHIRLVLQGKQKSEKLLRLIAERCPMMFDICKTCDEVDAWWADYKRGKEVA